MCWCTVLFKALGSEVTVAVFAFTGLLQKGKTQTFNAAFLYFWMQTKKKKKNSLHTWGKNNVYTLVQALVYPSLVLWRKKATLTLNTALTLTPWGRPRSPVAALK